MQTVEPLLPIIHRLVSTLTTEQILALATSLNQVKDVAWDRLRYDLLSLNLHGEGQRLLADLFHAWEQIRPLPAPMLVAAALLGACYTYHVQQDDQSIELVWTGPEPPTARLRRTEQALIELIQSAQERVLIVSFAVYRADEIIAALVAAVKRDVSLHICVEAPDPSGEKIAYDTIAALGSPLTRAAHIYVWPKAMRAVDANGRYGSLHAKCAVADRRLLFISSANLTGYAMDLNMELGLLVRGGPQPGKVDGYFQQLIDLGVLQRVA